MEEDGHLLRREENEGDKNGEETKREGENRHNDYTKKKISEKKGEDGHCSLVEILKNVNFRGTKKNGHDFILMTMSFSHSPVGV